MAQSNQLQGVCCAMLLFLSTIYSTQAKSFSEFFEYFQTTEVVIETNFGTSNIDKILSIARHKELDKIKEANSKIIKLIESEIYGKSKEEIVSAFEESGSLCRSIKMQIVCSIYKYEVTRPPGNSTALPCRRQYIYKIKINTSHIDGNSVEARFKYDDSTCKW